MKNVILTLPEKTRRDVAVKPKIAQAWIAGLPLADTVATARQLHQTFYALNRQEIPAQDRFELCELYASPIAAITAAFQPQFTRLALPFSPAKKQLAEFLIHLQIEMAYGYKHVIADALAHGQRLKPDVLTMALERAVTQLGEVLLCSYQFYAPPPPGVWRELHALYDYAERTHTENEWVAPLRDDDARSTVLRRYKKVLLLGLSGPYQLPPNECRRVFGFLEAWADKAVLGKDLRITNPVGHFLVDLTVDAPPRAALSVKPNTAGSLRVLNATMLAGTVHGFIARLQRGESPKALELGTDCIGSVCVDMFRRMIKAWGLSPRRQSHRIRRHDAVPVCVGLNAIHFFASGQEVFSASLSAADESAQIESDSDVLNIDLETLDHEADPASAVAPQVQQVFRVDEWRMRDESANGFALARSGQGYAHVRIGDIVGIEADEGHWRAAAVRWLKSGDADDLEMGVELLGPSITAVRIKINGAPYHRRALQIPEMPALRRSASLVMSPGVELVGQTVEITDNEGNARETKIVEVIERTGAYLHVALLRSNRMIPAEPIIPA